MAEAPIICKMLELVFKHRPVKCSCANYFEKKKKQQTTKSMKNYPVGKELRSQTKERNTTVAG